MPDAIKPEAIPGAAIDTEAITTGATGISAIATSVRDNGGLVHTKWQGMAAVYIAPEASTVLELMAPVSSQSTTTGDNLDVVSAALAQFAVDVAPIKKELDSLRTQATWFVENVVDKGVNVQEITSEWISYQSSHARFGPVTSTAGAKTDEPTKYETVHKEWHEDQTSVDRNNELIAAVNAQMVLMWEAERTAANKIRALYGGAPLHAYESENDPNGYGLDEIPEGTEMPWGAPVERTEGCGEATVNFVFKDFLWEGIVVGGIWGTIQGLGTLVLGYNPATGEWFSGDAYGAAWSNLGLLAADLIITTTPGLNLVFAADDAAQAMGGGFLPKELQDFKDKADEAALNTGKAIIAWDKWQDDPGTALGETVFNVGTILIPAGAAVAGVKTAGTAASVLSKMARVADLVDPGAWVMNGAVKAGGLGLDGLKAALGKLDLGGVDLGKIDVYRGVDPTSAVNAMVDDLHIPVDRITVRIDDGIPVLEAPGVRVELPAGSVDLPGGGAVDATVPVRQPELVTAGGGAPHVVDSVVGEAPVRTEPVGSGESTVVQDPTTTGGSSTGHGGADTGGGHGSEPGSGGGSGDAVPPAHDGAGEGWTSGPEHRGDAVDPNYGEPRPDHGALDDRFAPPEEIPADVRHLVTDPEAPYGRGADGEPYTRAEWEERYMGPNDRPIYPGNDGAVAGTRVSFTDMSAFRAEFGDTIDRLGGNGGSYLSPEGVPFEHRALPGSNLDGGYHVFRLTDELPPGVHIEVSEVAPAFGQPGGGIQLQFVDDAGNALSVDQLLSPDYHIIETTTPTPHLDAGAQALSDLQSPVPGSADVTALHYDSVPVDMQRAIIRHEYPGLLGINATRFDAGAAGFDMNCTRCVVATDRLFDGAETSAMPLYGSSGASVTDIYHALGSTQQFVPVSGYSSIVDTLGNLPEGSRGIVLVDRTPRVGHVFNAIHDKNGIVFLDAQTGGFAHLETGSRLWLLITKTG